MEKIIIASNNAGKLREFRAILEPFGLEVVSQREAGFCQDVEETGTTFAENAAIKAKAVYAAMHCPVIADDSGLMVDALDGAPGVYSHRFAGEGANGCRPQRQAAAQTRRHPRRKAHGTVCLLALLSGCQRHGKGVFRCL